MRLLGACAALSLLCLTAAQAAPKDEIYDEQELIPLQGSYLRGWRDNYDNVFAPRFTEEERRRLARVEFRMERRRAGVRAVRVPLPARPQPGHRLGCVAACSSTT